VITKVFLVLLFTTKFPKDTRLSDANKTPLLKEIPTAVAPGKYW
jgi:hypothetical protein